MGEAVTRYEVYAEPAGRYWHIEVPAIASVTQALKREDIEMMARDLIECMTDRSAVEMRVHIEDLTQAEQERRRAEAEPQR